MLCVAEYCADCDFTYDLDQALSAPIRIQQLAAEVAGILQNSDIDLRRRLEPDTWSPLEYGCHIRDVLLVQRERKHQKFYRQLLGCRNRLPYNAIADIQQFTGKAAYSIPSYSSGLGGSRVVIGDVQRDTATTAKHSSLGWKPRAGSAAATCAHMNVPV
jgi:hypothetical protein